MKTPPPFKPGLFALGFLGAYSVVALILFFTLGESLAGSGTTPRTIAGPDTFSDNDLPPYETDPSNAAPENGKPVFVANTQSPDPSGPPWDGGFSGDATSSIFRNEAPAPTPANALPSSFAPGTGRSPYPFGASLFTAGFGFAGTGGTPPGDTAFLPIDLSDPLIENIGPIIQNVKLLPDVPGGGGDGSKPPINGDPPPGKPDQSPPLATVSLPEPLTISLFATGALIVLRRGRKKTPALN